MFGYKCMFYVVLLDVAQRIESSVRSQIEEEQCISLFSVVEDNDIVAGVYTSSNIDYDDAIFPTFVKFFFTFSKIRSFLHKMQPLPSFQQMEVFNNNIYKYYSYTSRIL